MRVPGLFRLSPRFTSAAIVLLVSVVMVGTQPAGVIAQNSVSATEASSEELPLVRVSLAPETALIDVSAETAVFNLEIENNDTAALRVNSIAFFVDQNRVNSSSVLGDRLTNPKVPTGIDFATASLQGFSVPEGDRSIQSLVVATSSLQLPAVDAPGVYLLYARVTAQQGEQFVAVTPFVWQGTGVDEPTRLHTVVPLVLPNSIDGMPTLSQLGELTASGGRLASTVSAAIAFDSTLAIDPRLIAATETYGELAPTSATALVQQLQAVANPTFALQYADADLSAQAQLGLSTPLTPQGFGYLIEEPDFEPPSSFSYSLADVAWPRGNTVTDESLSFMKRSGIGTVLMNSSNLTSSTQVAGVIDTTRVVSFPQFLQDSAAEAIAANTSIARSAGSAQLVSHLALFNQNSPSQNPVTLGLDRAGASIRSVAPLLETLSSLPWIRPGSLDEVFAQQSEMSVVNQPISQDRLDDLRQALDNEPFIDTYGSVLAQPVYLTQLQRLRVLEFFSASLGSDNPGYAETAKTYFDRDEQTLQAVRITTSSTTNLVGTSTRLPIQVTNDLPFTALMSATTVASNSSLLIEEPRSAVTVVSKNSSVNITVPVRARVSAGQTSLVVTIYTQDGLAIDEAVLSVNIRSSWESLALSVLGLLVAAFFGFGIWRSIRSKRQQNTAQPSDSEQS